MLDLRVERALKSEAMHLSRRMRFSNGSEDRMKSIWSTEQRKLKRSLKTKKKPICRGGPCWPGCQFWVSARLP